MWFRLSVPRELARHGIDLALLSVMVEVNQPRMVLGVVTDHKPVLDLGAQASGEVVEFLADDEERRRRVHALEDAEDRRRVWAGSVIEGERDRAATVRPVGDERRVTHHGRDL